MTPPSGRVSGSQPGRPVLVRLVPDPEDFGSTMWGHASQLSRARDLPSGFEDLFSTGAADELLSERGLRTPFLRVAKDGATFGDKAFTGGGGVGAGISDQISDDRLTALFAEGCTLVLQALHRTWPPLIDFVQQLSTELGHPVQANAYITPPQSQGFDDHYDVHDVFVLQVEGQKRWRIHDPVHPDPLRDQPWTDRAADVASAAERAPVLDEVLSPGDCLYLPRGYLHAASALGETSIHLTLGVHVWTRFTLAEELTRLALASLADDEEARRSLPLGTDVADADDITVDLALVRSSLARALQDVTDEELAADLLGRLHSSARAAPVGPLGQTRTAMQLEPTDRVTLRSHLAARLVEQPGGGGTTLVSRAGRLTLDRDEVQRVRRVLDEGQADVAELGVEFARRLVRAAIVVAG